MICVSEHENMMHHLLFRSCSICSAPRNKHANTSKSLHADDWGGNGALCYTWRTKHVASRHPEAALQYRERPLEELPEEIFQAGQLVAGQVDDDGLLVCLSMKEVWGSGQQNGFVGSERPRGCVQRHIGLQLLLQQPGGKQQNTTNVFLLFTESLVKSCNKKSQENSKATQTLEQSKSLIPALEDSSLR